MKKYLILLALVACLWAADKPISIRVYPSTTTVQAETSNNTSASNSFTGWSNGNEASTNISKVDVHKLLQNPKVTVFAELQGWWGYGSHPSIGYSSNNLTQMKMITLDMQSRGIQGVILDWYGQGSNEDKTAAVMQQASELYSFPFFLTVDSGAIQWHSCSGCTPTQAVIADLNYIRKYVASPMYFKINGRPVVMYFGMEAYTIDWDAVRASNPDYLFIFRNSGGFTHVQTDGAFAWLAPTTSTDWSTYEGLSYFDGFYNAWYKYPTKIAFGSGYKGFNGDMSSWSKGKHIAQLCGKTWLDSMARQPSNVQYIQLVTWDDYEEGTELETGIDNCLTLTGFGKYTGISWTVTPDESTLDHYEIYASFDGSHLWKVADVPVGQNYYDLSSIHGTFYAYVKAIGKSMIKNHMSDGVRMQN